MHPADHIFGYIVVTTILILPALALTLRFGLVPLLELRRRKDVPSGLDERIGLLEGEIRELHEENATLRADVQALQSAETFYRQLQRPAPAAAGGASLPGGDAGGTRA